MNKQEAAAAFRDLAFFLELAEDTPLRIRTYAHASKTIAQSVDGFEKQAMTGHLRHLAGIGKEAEEAIATFYRTGQLPLLEELRHRFPPTLLELKAIPGLGVKRIKALYDELGVDSAVSLAQACEHNRIALLKGFGPKIQENILDGLEYIRSFQGLRLLNRVYETSCPLREYMAKAPGLWRLDLTGSLRRGRELVRNIDLLACAEKPDAVIEWFLAYPGKTEVRGRDASRASMLLELAIPADLRIVPPEEYPFALAHFTGSNVHNQALRTRAEARGLKLTEHGLFQENGTPLACRDEVALYAALGLPYIPPELRENMGELALKRTPELVSMRDFRGLIHCHTTYSDGLNSIVEMASAAQGKGYHYIVITDHSQSAVYANGMTPARVLEQRSEIDAINRTLTDFQIIQGIESDIREDGSLDYEPEILAKFEVVLASIHTSHEMPADAMTRRLLKAIQNPYTNAIAHPTGRLLLSRKGYSFNFDKVFQACAAHRVAIEINANCRRLDLDWRYLQHAKSRGVKFMVGPDAHSLERLDGVSYGIGMARKGALGPKDLLNSMEKEELLAWCKAKRP